MNKVAIVTGGAMGWKAGGKSIGGAIAISLANDGYKIVVADLGEMGERTVDIIKKSGGEAIFIKTDVTITDNIQNIITTTKSKYKGLNCLGTELFSYFEVSP